MTELAKRSSKPKLIRASRLVGPLLEEERGEWHCQVNGSKVMISPRHWQTCDSSLHACRLLPMGKSPSSEESIVNCFEMVANTE